MLPGNIPQGHTLLGGLGGHSWLGYAAWQPNLRGTLKLGCVGGHSWLLDTFPGFWICCLATYLRGTLIGMVWGAFLAAGYAAWQHTSGAHSLGWCGGHSWLLNMLPGDIPQGHTLLVWVAWGAFLAAEYAAWRHTSGAHSFGWCGGYSWLLDMLPGNIP
jgi:hypothetical protein